MICLGNICRSPLAEGIMRKKIEEHNLDWEVDSAGTADWNVGKSPDKRSIKIALQNDIDISKQRARSFSLNDFDIFDRILVMDSENYQAIKQKTNQESHLAKVDLLMNYYKPGFNISVPDPYYSGEFEKVYDLINLACTAIVNDSGNFTK